MGQSISERLVLQHLKPYLSKEAHRDTYDEPFAWDSREYMRNLCIGKVVSFIKKKEDNPSPVAGTAAREFGCVLLDGKDVSKVVASNGWAQDQAAYLRHYGWVSHYISNSTEYNRYTYKVCSYKKATQEEGHMTRRLGFRVLLYAIYCALLLCVFAVHICELEQPRG